MSATSSGRGRLPAWVVRISPAPAISLHLAIEVTQRGAAPARVLHQTARRGPRCSARRYMHACSCDNACMGHGLEPDLSGLTAETARTVADTMHALATPSRVRILSRLATGPCSVGELARHVAMEQSAVSQQLRVLRHLGLVVG